MRKNLLLFLTFLSLSCSKTEDVGYKYPKTELSNTTWKKYSFTAVITGNKVYEFLHFNGTTTVDIYSADAEGKKLVGTKDNYPCTIKTSDKNMDSFEIKYPNGNTGIGFTTEDVKTITYNDYEYTKVE